MLKHARLSKAQVSNCSNSDKARKYLEYSLVVYTNVVFHSYTKFMTFIIVIISILVAIGLIIALGYANIGLQILRYPKYWEAQAKIPNTNNTLTYVALGDSTAQGIGATSPARGYVGLVAKELESKYNRPVKVINVSKSGALVADVLQSQLQQIKDIKPDIVTIEIGANDVRNYDKQRFESEYGELAKKLPKGTYVSNMPRFDDSNARAIAIEMNGIIADLAKQNDLVLVPLFEYTSRNTSIWRNSTDRFHPSNQSYKYWAAAFLSQILSH